MLALCGSVFFPFQSFKIYILLTWLKWGCWQRHCLPRLETFSLDLCLQEGEKFVLWDEVMGKNSTATFWFDQIRSVNILIYDHDMAWGKAKLQDLHPATYRSPPKLIIVMVKLLCCNYVHMTASWPLNCITQQTWGVYKLIRYLIWTDVGHTTMPLHPTAKIQIEMVLLSVGVHLGCQGAGSNP